MSPSEVMGWRANPRPPGRASLPLREGMVDVSRRLLRVAVVVSSSLQASFAVIPLLGLPAEGRGPGVLVLSVMLILSAGGVGLVAQSGPTLRDAAIVTNAGFFLFTLPQNVRSCLDLPHWGTMTLKQLAIVWLAMAWGGSCAVNVLALAEIKRQDARGKGKAPSRGAEFID
jgi:hypothetical protein